MDVTKIRRPDGMARITTKEQAEEVCRHADGYIIGSALVKRFGNAS